MSTPFDGKLPYRYSARKMDRAGTVVYLVFDAEGVNVTTCQVDKVFTVADHLKYIWRKHDEQRSNGPDQGDGEA